MVHCERDAYAAACLVARMEDESLESATSISCRQSGTVRDKNAKLDNGRPVYSSADTLRWMLENMEPAWRMHGT